MLQISDDELGRGLLIEAVDAPGILKVTDASAFGGVCQAVGDLYQRYVKSVVYFLVFIQNGRGSVSVVGRVDFAVVPAMSRSFHSYHTIITTLRTAPRARLCVVS